MLGVLSFCYWDTECLTSFNKDNSADFSGEKKYNEVSGMSIFEREKTLSQYS